jgi:hypothetical protein
MHSLADYKGQFQIKHAESRLGHMRGFDWRVLQVRLIPVLVALFFGLANMAGAFRLADAWFFDYVTLRENGRPPVVVIIESDPAFTARLENGYAALTDAAFALGVVRMAFPFDPGFERKNVIVATRVKRIPGTHTWQPLQYGAKTALFLSAADYGIHRNQIGQISGRSGPLLAMETMVAGRKNLPLSYLVRLSKNQNLPRITATQLLAGDVDKRALKGKIALVEPATKKGLVTTARGVISVTDYRAAAIQTLADAREVKIVPPLIGMLLFLFAGILLGWFYAGRDIKRSVLPVLGISLAMVIGGAGLLVMYANWLVPVAALVLTQLTAALLVLHRAEMDEDVRLRSFVTQTVNLSLRNSLLRDFGQLPGFLAATATSLGITQMIMFTCLGKGGLHPVIGDDTIIADMARDTTARRDVLAKARIMGQPVAAEQIAPDWEGLVQLAPLGLGDDDPYWLYAIPDGPGQSGVALVAASLAASYRSIQKLRSNVGARAKQNGRYRPADEWASSAVALIAGRAEQVAGGADGLETALVLFHVLGFPIHANTKMSALYDIAGLSLSDSTLEAALLALTDLDPPRVAALVHDLLLHGGEARVSCRDLDGRSRIMRVVAPKPDVAARVLTLEALDVTELKRLSELRLAVTNFFDSQIRNDLEAIAVAATVARDPRLDPEKRTKMLGRIDEAATRASGRLNAIAKRTYAADTSGLNEAYPIDAAKILRDALDLLAPMLRELGVRSVVEMPEISGFTVADPNILVELIEAILRITAADTARGEAFITIMREEKDRTTITITGGIGMAFDRLYAALGAAKDDAPAPFWSISRGITEATRWGAMVTYSSGVGQGYKFVIVLRRIE